MFPALLVAAVFAGAGGLKPAPTKTVAFAKAAAAASSLPVVILARPYDGACTVSKAQRRARRQPTTPCALQAATLARWLARC